MADREQLAKVIGKALGDVTGIFDTTESEDLALADAVLAAGFGLVADAKAEAFEQGQKSGLRYATRAAAATRMGKPELAGPMSPNPYRAAS